MKVLVAGATGYLGGYIIKELQKRKLDFVALARNAEKLKKQNIDAHQMKIAEVTQANDLKGICDGVEVVISTLGITRQKDGLTYRDVDYQANLNLLKEAIRAGVKKFIYISVINGASFRHLKLVEAKEMFVDELKASPIQHTVIRPNGFFSDMKDFLAMAEKGTVYLFGKGNFKLNPIHGEDLAVHCVDAINSHDLELSVGGPDILTQHEIAILALKAFGNPIKIVHLPDWIRRLSLFLMIRFTSVKTYGPFEFFLNLLAQDNIAPRSGLHRLQHFFKAEADKIR
tara:strand:+ start:292 stop:1146 length:855 start_codon:yes stop_codon:yes gene_type:complete